MVPEANQSQVRSKTLNGSPKKNAALFGSSKYSGGKSVGLVATYQKARKAMNSPNCQRRSALLELLLGIALEHFILHGAPDQGMQLDEARREADLGDVARPRQIDGEFADRMRLGSCREHHHPVGKRNGLLEVVRDEHHRLAVRRPELEQLVLHQLARLD